MSQRLLVRDCDALVQPGDLRNDVDIVIADGRIASIEPSGALAYDGDLDVLDGSGLLAMPGLVNAHTHSPENCLRGVAEGRSLEAWVYQLYAAADSYDADDHYVCALAGAVEMLLSGTTSCLDHLWMTSPRPDAVEAALRAYRDVGIRAAVAPLMSDADVTEDLGRAYGVDLEDLLLTRRLRLLPAAELIVQLENVMGKWHGAENGRLRVLAGPSGVQWCSAELLEGLADVARRYDSGVHLHLLETELQAAMCQAFGPHGALGVLDQLGILGPSCSLAHGVWLQSEDIQRIADRGAVLVHNPASNLRLRSGRAPVPQLLSAGARLALGTDGAASSDNQDMWDALKLASLVHSTEPPAEDCQTGVSAAQALRMATVGGAAAMGKDDLGTLVPGALADVVLLDRNGSGLAGALDVEVALALSETGRSIRHVVVGGRQVVSNGRCLTVDQADVFGRLHEQATKRRASHISSNQPGERAGRIYGSLLVAVRASKEGGRSQVSHTSLEEDQ